MKPCRHWTASASTILVAAATTLASLCGVADAKCIPPVATQPPASPTTGAYFAEVPGAFPDLFPYLNAFGREVAIIQDVIVADLNCDGRPDVLIHMFGNLDYAQRGQDIDAAVPNRLLAFIQQPDGTFLDRTLSVLGSAYVDLRGLSVTTGTVITNMTGDGYPGFALQVNREDGRGSNGPAGYAANTAQTPFVVSNGDGTYRVQFVGRSDWHSIIALAPMTNGTPDVIVNGASPEAFRVRNGQIQSVAGYPDRLGGSFVFFPPEPGKTYSSTVSTQVYEPGHDGVVTLQFGLVSADAQGQWSTVSFDSPFTSTTLVPFISWQGNSSLNLVMTFKGKTYAYANFESTCLLHRIPGREPTVAFRWNSFGLPATYRTGDPVDLRVANLVNGNTLLGFDVSGSSFSYADLNIIGEDTQVSYQEIQCGDFNGDGLDDIVVKSISGRIGSTANFTNGMPLFYLNNGQGGFVVFNQSSLPELPPAWMATGGNCIVAKITAGGLNDMLCWNVNNFASPPSMHPIVFKALRPLTPPRLPAPPTAVVAIAGNAQATISFSVPPDVIGYPITGYTATCLPGGIGVSALASPINVTGLTNGVIVACSVTAHNLVGFSIASPSASVTPSASTAAVNYQGLWWKPEESGWGINFAHQGDIVFATWFTYDAQGKPRWLIAQLDMVASGVYEGPVSTVTGPPFGSVPFPPGGNPGGAVETPIGTMTATFADARHGTIVYTVSGVTQTKAIVPQAFGALPTCTWGAQSNLSLATNYTDLWWNANESGWGVNFTHQGDIIFATWFTYDDARQPWWLIAQLDKAAGGVYAGPVSTVTGPAFGSAPFPPGGSPGGAIETPVGSATVSFANGNAATFSSTVDGTAQTKAISRQVFVAPGTVCR